MDNLQFTIKDLAGLLSLLIMAITIVSFLIKNAKAAGAKEQKDVEMKKDLDGMGRKINNVMNEVKCNATKIQEQEVKSGKTEILLESIAHNIQDIFKILEDLRRVK